MRFLSKGNQSKAVAHQQLMDTQSLTDISTLVDTGYTFIVDTLGQLPGKSAGGGLIQHLV